MLRNVLPRPLPAGMALATCPAWARWDMLAKPGWAAASAHPRRIGVACSGQHSPFSPACLGCPPSRTASGGMWVLPGVAHGDMGPQPPSRCSWAPKACVETSLSQALFLTSSVPAQPTRAVLFPHFTDGERETQVA